jgi:hypothetical protein
MHDPKESRIQTKVVECNTWSTSQVVNKVRSVVTASPQHRYFFNAATGTRATDIAGKKIGLGVGFCKL